MKDSNFLAKWLNSEITEEELKQYVSEEEISAYKKIISATDQLEKPDFNLEEALAEIKKTKDKTSVRKLSFINYFYRVAAILTVIISSYYFISNKTTNYATNLAEKTVFELPDQSKVHLNADSKITYKAKNWETNRTLKLKGEAFFSVQKGSDFTVKSNLGTVQVLGTKFNVIERANYFEVICYEGLVSVTYNKKTVKIPYGNSFKLLNQTPQLIENIDGKQPAWLENNSSFKSMPFSYVISELERQYDIAIEYDSNYKERLFTGNFTHNNLILALKAISIPMNLNYIIISDKKVRLAAE